MTIGEKISKLRQGKGLSQEQLAEKLCVSRQSISKWEMDQALPQIDNVLQLSDIFKVSVDTLLKLQTALKRKNISARTVSGVRPMLV